MERSKCNLPSSNAFQRRVSKIRYQAICLGVLMATLVACQKEIIPPKDEAIASEEGKILHDDASARKIPSRYQLAEFIYYSVRYRLYYNQKQNVDSIELFYPYRPDPITYRVHFKDRGTRMDTVILIVDGEWISRHTNFHYDKKGRITQYTYYPNLPWEEDPNAYAKTYTITYDNKDRVTSINGVLFTYDRNDDLVQIQNGPDTYSFTYSNASPVNPLHYVPNLFAIMIEEHGVWEFTISKHNPEVKIYPPGSEENPGDSEKIYRYDYDSRHRVTRMYPYWNGFGEPTEDFYFYYMN
jgi:hypothetical protein